MIVAYLVFLGLEVVLVARAAGRRTSLEEVETTEP